MTAIAESAALEGAFLAAWGTTTPVALENRAFVPPKNQTPWVRLKVLPASAFKADLGSEFYRHSGVISVQVFTRPGGGAGPARSLADQVAAVFRGKRFTLGDTLVHCFAPTQTTVGATADGWFQINVTCPFQRDTHY
jgi:hypothetical protein